MHPNMHGQMTRSWTRHISSAGPAGGMLDLPYPGHLPTLGLLKRKRGGANHLTEIQGGDYEGSLPPRHIPNKPSNSKGANRRGYDFYDNQSTIDAGGNNPFGREQNTEKLLLAREKERELKEITKGDLEGLRVFEKEIATR